MTGTELIEEVLKLGLNSQAVYPVQPEAIYVHINRAIAEVNRLCPLLGTVSILHFPIKPTTHLKGIQVHRGGEDLEINASDVKSLAFAVSGTGRARLYADNLDTVYTFEWLDQVNFKNLGGFIIEMLGAEQADVHLVFEGQHTYMIRDVSFYSETVSDLAEDIVPYTGRYGYDMAKTVYAGDAFIDFSHLPIRYNDVDLNAPTDFKIEGSVIHLPAGKPGEYTVSYYKRPIEVDADNKDEEIDVDARLHDLLALRAAYYFYLVIDREISEKCNAEYMRQQSLVMATMRKVRTPRQFRDVRGW